MVKIVGYYDALFLIRCPVCGNDLEMITESAWNHSPARQILEGGPDDSLFHIQICPDNKCGVFVGSSIIGGRSIGFQAEDGEKITLKEVLTKENLEGAKTFIEHGIMPAHKCQAPSDEEMAKIYHKLQETALHNRLRRIGQKDKGGRNRVKSH